MTPEFEALFARFGDAVEADLNELVAGPPGCKCGTGVPCIGVLHPPTWRRTMTLLKQMQQVQRVGVTAFTRVTAGVVEDEDDKVSVAEVRQILLKRIADEESPVFARVWAETYSLLKG